MSPLATCPCDAAKLRQEFPFFEDFGDGKPIAYLDSAATAHRPRQVLAAMDEYHRRYNSNVHRGTYALARIATGCFEGARQKIARFIGADSASEVIFTKNATEAINLVSNVLLWAEGPHRVRSGDSIVISRMEHHSNMVPWQLLADRTGARLEAVDITEDGRIDLSAFAAAVTERTKVVSITHVSNVLGTINPIDVLAARAHEVGALMVVDAAQSAPHMPLDVGKTCADFVAFTGHKMCGPTGIGVLWGRLSLLASLPPFLGGGEMIDDVGIEGSTFASPPHRFEAGTPPIAQAIGLGAAVDFLSGVGMAAVAAHEHAITAYALARLAAIDGVRILGPPAGEERAGVISFVLEGVETADVGEELSRMGIAVRVGHHCAKLACLRFGVPSTIRASFHLYTTSGEIDLLVAAVKKVHDSNPVRRSR